MPDSVEAARQLSPEVRAEAAAWVARLHGSDRSTGVEAGLQRWLAADPINARAFEVATEAWELGGAVPRGALPRASHTGAESTRPARLHFARAAVAATIVAAGGLTAALYLRDPTYSTGTGEQRTLALEDGTRIALNTDTRLLVNYTQKRRQVRLETGEAFFDVAKAADRPFIVTAGEEAVVAVGTSFVVRRNDREVDVTLVEGRVSVTPLGALTPAAVPAPESRILTPGQRLRVTGSTPILDEPDIEAVTAWRRGEVVLDHTRLADAAAEMNRYSAVKLVVETPGLADIQVSGIFRAGDSERFARAIAETYKLEMAEDGHRIRFARASESDRH